MKTEFIILLFLLSVHHLFAQCPTEDVLLTTQSEVDDFSVQYSNCSSIPYSIRIEGDNINNLNGLSFINSIDGLLKISFCDGLSTLSGLENLNRVDSTLQIRSCDNLVHLDALSNLDSIGYRLLVGDNDALTSLQGLINVKYPFSVNISGNHSLVNLQGLNNIVETKQQFWIELNGNLKNLNGVESLKKVGGILLVRNEANLENINDLSSVTEVLRSLAIERNKKIKNLEGLNNIEFVGLGDNSTGVIISQNDSLETLQGLENLKRIEGGLYIGTNPQLLNIDGLSSLNYVEGLMLFQLNPSLISIEGLSELDTLNGTLQFWENISLTSLSGLDNAKLLGPSVDIFNNFALSVCHVESICNYISDSTHAATIVTNDVDCNSRDEVLVFCDSIASDVDELDFSTEKGLVFPNPTSGEFSLKGKESAFYEITIFDALGRNIKTQEVYSNQIVSISQLDAGLYFLLIKNGKQFQMTKLIKR